MITRIKVIFFTYLVNNIATKKRKMDEVLKIVIADDNEVLVDMMKKWIEKNERYQVIGMARDRNDEMYLIDTLKPNVVITDIKRERWLDWIRCCRKYMDSEYKPIFFYCFCRSNRIF